MARVIKSTESGVSTAAALWSTPPARRPAAPAAPPPPPANAVRPDEIQQAYQRGRQEGEAAAREAAERTLQAQLAELAASVASLADLRRHIIRTAQKDVLQLSIAIARRILHREVLMAEDVLKGIVSVTLDKLEGQEVSRLRVHPNMVARMESLLGPQLKNRRVQVVGDAALRLGGCLFETARGNVDAGLESQLAEIEQGLADHLEVSQ